MQKCLTEASTDKKEISKVIAKETKLKRLKLSKYSKLLMGIKVY